MKNGKKVTAIILIAGNSARYGQNRNKNFEKINGKYIVSYSLDAFDKNEYIDNMIIAVKEDEFQKVQEIINLERYNKKIDIVVGGRDRKESVYNCIKTSSSDIVIIHDGARPMIKQHYINRCIESMDKYKGATIGVKSKDTIKIANSDNIVLNTIDRNNAWIIQTPQCFERETLVRMHEKYKDELVTDDSILLEKDNYDVKIIEGDYTNIKITTYEDLEIIKNLLKNNSLYDRITS